MGSLKRASGVGQQPACIMRAHCRHLGDKGDIEVGRKMFGQRVHTWRSNPGRCPVIGGRPIDKRSVRLRGLRNLTELGRSRAEILGAMIKGDVCPDPPGRHPSAKTAPLVQHEHVPSSINERTGTGQAGDPGANYDCTVGHGGHPLFQRSRQVTLQPPLSSDHFFPFDQIFPIDKILDTGKSERTQQFCEAHMTLAPGRLTADQIAENFSDLHSELGSHEALVAADRCYFCHDAPCTVACPTDIDIPMFIRQIQAGQPKAAARTIFDQNILGGMCARVCPVETLCEQACVREAAEGKPVEIGRLQRYATDAQMATGAQPYTRAEPTGKTVGIVGAGPAGLAAAHRLAMHGHAVALYDARPKGGGLNEYGIAAYKTVDDFAAREVDWLLSIGGIKLKTGQRLGENVDAQELRDRHDALLLAMGLGGVNGLRAPGEDLPGVEDAVDFIARVRQDNRAKIPVGRNVVVIGGGMTAIDAAVQAKLLGAETVTIAYRRGRDAMPASRYEQDLATSRGVVIREHLTPVKVMGEAATTAIKLAYTQVGAEGLVVTDETLNLPCDQVLKAIGQTLDLDLDLDLDDGWRKIAVDEEGRTSEPGIWAAGDCTPGEDLTVVAVAEGRDAAESIHRSLIA